MFVTTANTLNIPPALMDRMEIIRLAGYTEDEKIEIAKRHLIPAARRRTAWSRSEWSVDDEALLELIRRYTREAGVRSLEREIAKLARKAVKEILTSAEQVGHGHGWTTSKTISACRSTATARPSSRIRSASSRALPGPRSAARC